MFCPACGTSPVERSAEDSWHCSICQAEYKITVVKTAQLTLEEAEAKFNAIPLTDKKALNAAKRKKVNS